MFFEMLKFVKEYFKFTNNIFMKFIPVQIIPYASSIFNKILNI